MGKVRSTYLWSARDIVNQPDEILVFSDNNGVTDIYVMLSSSITDETYRSFNKKAAERGIRIHALNGDEKWALISYYPKIQSFLDRVKMINENVSTVEEKFSGVHLDIEPHTLRFSDGDIVDWKTQQTEIIRQWKYNVLQYTGFARHVIGVSVSCALQMGMDNIPSDDPDFPYVSDWMIDKHDFVVVMAYRNFAEGHDGIIYHSQTEVDGANSQGKPDSVVVAVETLDVTPEKITFFNKSCQYMYQELQKVDTHFSTKPSYAGHAIHTLSQWMVLPL